MVAGKYLRFPELFEDGPLVISPIDDLLISGPANGLLDPEYKIHSIFSSRPSAVLTFYGIVKKYYKDFSKQKSIINLSGSTTRSVFTKKVLLGSLETALRVNANAVAIHINICSKYAEKMISDAALIIEQAEKYAIPVVGIIYPRGEHKDGSPNENDDLKVNDIEAFSEIVAHCAQIGVNLGVDLIKTQYTGSQESFKKVIAAAQEIPVVIAGGPLISKETSIKNAVDAVKCGCRGISYARNVFGRENPKEYIEEVRREITNI